MGKRPGITDNSILFRVLVSFFMAVVLFVHAPLEARAAQVSGQVSIAPHGTQALIPLNFFGNYTQDGSDRDTRIPYSYSGKGTFSFDIYRPSSSAQYRYVSGTASTIVQLGLSSQITGLEAKRIMPYLSYASLPDGLTVSMADIAYNSGGTTFRLVFNFDMCDVTSIQIAGITFGIDLAIGAQANAFGASYTNAAIAVKFATDFTDGGLRFYQYRSDTDPDAANLRAQLSTANAALDVINGSITSQTDALLAKIQQHIENDNRIINDFKMSEWSNAQDIMHSYDKTAQDTDNERFEDSRKELQEYEDSLFDSASSGFGSLDMGDYGIGKFSAMQGAFSFVSGFIQSCYVKMGDFGAVVTVGLVLLIATKVIGLFRFQVVEH